jgi:hypothetical protein
MASTFGREPRPTFWSKNVDCRVRLIARR